MGDAWIFFFLTRAKWRLVYGTRGNDRGKDVNLAVRFKGGVHNMSINARRK